MTRHEATSTVNAGTSRHQVVVVVLVLVFAVGIAHLESIQSPTGEEPPKKPSSALKSSEKRHINSWNSFAETTLCRHTGFTCFTTRSSAGHARPVLKTSINGIFVNRLLQSSPSVKGLFTLAPHFIMGCAPGEYPPFQAYGFVLE